MALLKRMAAWLSDLRLAIVLLLMIALASAVGTAIPQGDPPASYVDAYASSPWLGLLHGEQVLQLQLDHVYSSGWFLALLAWLGLALILCSWRRQWPALMAARRWIDYLTQRQLILRTPRSDMLVVRSLEPPRGTGHSLAAQVRSTSARTSTCQIST